MGCKHCKLSCKKKEPASEMLAADDKVSEFIVRRCRRLPKSKINIFRSIHLLGSVPLKEYGIAIFCGSCVEFFIHPVSLCIDDVDCLRMKSNSLAFTDENPVLPYDLRHIADPINCFLMEPYLDYPAFIRLRLLGQMIYNWERNIFEFIKANVQEIAITTKMNAVSKKDHAENPEEWCKIGPATRLLDIEPSFDAVVSIWCPQWPNEANEWTNRQRLYGWPTTAIIHEVVQNGCHVVFAKHPACRNDFHQCRLSFSVAEVILLNSWTSVQQIVYHLLRFFAKKELIKKDCPKEDEVLCTYHFKTLMLWSCEEMSPDWWNSLSVVKICCNLLKKLAKWLKEARCPNYFIPQANLFHEHFNRKIVDETAKRLIFFHYTDILSLWLVEHYIRPSLYYKIYTGITEDMCTWQTHEDLKVFNFKHIDLLFSLRSHGVVQDAQDTVECRFSMGVSEFFKYMSRCYSGVGAELSFQPFAIIEPSFWDYASMLRILHAVHLIDCKILHYDSEWFVEVLRQISAKRICFSSKNHIFPRPLNTGANRSQLYLIKAQDLMENLIGSNDDPEFQLLSEISKGLLRKALECEDSKTKAIAKTTLAYMAALHYAASEYQTVIDLCSRVILNEKPEKEDTETLNAGCLLYVEDITKSIGFYLIFRKTKDASLHYTERQFFLDLRLTPQVFAYYLLISSVERTDEEIEIDSILQNPAFPLDGILLNLANWKSLQILQKKNILSVSQGLYSVNKSKVSNESSLLNENAIIRLLMKYSLSSMTLFYSAICKDFDIDCSTVDCYRAAYLYNCFKYPEVLHLCERILNEPDVRTDLKELAIANVMVVPPLDSYFDRDIQCLLGLHTLICYLLPSNEDFEETEVSETSTLYNNFAREIYSDKFLLSAVLVKSYSLKCHYFLQRHFLARYLKVRCLIECNHLPSAAMFEFKKLKACLPFEEIIRCFLEQKLWQLQKVVDAKYY